MAAWLAWPCGSCHAAAAGVAWQLQLSGSSVSANQLSSATAIAAAGWRQPAKSTGVMASVAICRRNGQ